MNETQLPDPRLDTPPPEETPEQRGTLGGRILGYSFLASVVINLGWLGWVSSSNLFGGKAPLDLHPQVIKMVKIAQKPKPKPPKKVPPPPPPPKQPPPKPLKTPPKVQPRHIKPRPAAPHPSPTHPVAIARSHNSITPAPSMPSAPPDPGPTVPFNPGPPEPKQPPTPPAPPQPEPLPPAPVVQAPKPDPPKPKQTPPPPPPVIVKPKGWVPIDTREAVDVQSVDVSADGIDASNINNNEVVISYTIDETGHVKNARVKKSCGSSELDNRVLRQVQSQRCAPAIQDHIPRESRQEFHFPVNS